MAVDTQTGFRLMDGDQEVHTFTLEEATEIAGFPLIAPPEEEPENRGMQNATSKQRDPARSAARVDALRREIDERDETIRLLNEALSQALDELERLDPRRAA